MAGPSLHLAKNLGGKGEKENYVTHKFFRDAWIKIVMLLGFSLKACGFPPFRLLPFSPFRPFFIPFSPFRPQSLPAEALLQVVIADQPPQGPPVGAVGGHGNFVQLDQKRGDGLRG